MIQRTSIWEHLGVEGEQPEANCRVIILSQIFRSEATAQNASKSRRMGQIVSHSVCILLSFLAAIHIQRNAPSFTRFPQAANLPQLDIRRTRGSTISFDRDRGSASLSSWLNRTHIISGVMSGSTKTSVNILMATVRGKIVIDIDGLWAIKDLATTDWVKHTITCHRTHLCSPVNK